MLARTSCPTRQGSPGMATAPGDGFRGSWDGLRLFRLLGWKAPMPLSAPRAAPSALVRGQPGETPLRTIGAAVAPGRGSDRRRAYRAIVGSGSLQARPNLGPLRRKGLHLLLCYEISHRAVPANWQPPSSIVLHLSQGRRNSPPKGQSLNNDLAGTIWVSGKPS
jgi:hypothetical protein